MRLKGKSSVRSSKSRNTTLFYIEADRSSDEVGISQSKSPDDGTVIPAELLSAQKRELCSIRRRDVG